MHRCTRAVTSIHTSRIFGPITHPRVHLPAAYQLLTYRYTRFASHIHTRVSLLSVTPPPHHKSHHKMAQPNLPHLPPLQRHSSRVLSILGLNPGPMTLQGTNTYLLGTGKKRLLVDTGEGLESYTKLFGQVLKDEQLDELIILISHWHADHTGGLKSICSLFPENRQPQIHKFNGAALLPSSVLQSFPELSSRIQTMTDGQQFSVEGATIRVIHTPGHTPDHCIFELLEEKAVLSGDTILGGSSAVFSDLHAYMHSLHRISTLKPTRIYPAHGAIIDGDEAMKTVDQYLHHRHQREAQILTAMKEREEHHQHQKHETQQIHKFGHYSTAMELVHKIYIDLSPSLRGAAANNVLLHLDKLLKEGRVTYEPESNPTSASQSSTSTVTSSPPPPTPDEDDCKAEHAKAHAIALERAKWRWKLINHPTTEAHQHKL